MANLFTKKSRKVLTKTMLDDVLAKKCPSLEYAKYLVNHTVQSAENFHECFLFHYQTGL